MTVANRYGQYFIVGNDALPDSFPERQLKKPRSVVLLVVHRENIIAVTSKHPLSRCHKNATLYFDFLIAEECRKRLGMYAYGLVRFVKDGEVELNACLPCRRS